MNTCYIVGAMPFEESFTVDGSDLVIAADGGQATLARLGIVPHLVVGDFDSSEAPTAVPFVRHPVEKDDTDTALAVKEGMKRGYEYFIFYGCTGGRFDHTLAAVQTLHRLSVEGLHGYLVFEDGTVGTVIVNKSLQFTPKGTVSVFSLTDESVGVSIEGLKYPLKGARLTNDFPLGVSNEGNGTPAKISVERGALLVIFQR